jgi:SET domain-containing protein
MSSRSFRVGRSATGLGLFATRPIKRGVYIAAYRGRRITTEEADRREARGARYMFGAQQAMHHRRLAAMERRALHQSFLPAECKASGTQGRIVIAALRRIEPGEEITYDYGRDYLKHFLVNDGCHCAACRRNRALRTGERARSGGNAEESKFEIRLSLNDRHDAQY